MFCGMIANMVDENDLADEERRLRELQRTVDLALFYLKKAPIARPEAESIVDLVRKKALDLFPDKGDTFDLIYQPRFNRLLSERFGLH